jgi:hypothetical protein
MAKIKTQAASKQTESTEGLETANSQQSQNVTRLKIKLGKADTS